MGTARLFAAAILLLLSAAPVWADEAEDAFNALYGNEYRRVAATPDKNDDAALAVALLKAAKAPGVQPALLAILCDKAYELGTKAPAGYDSAIEAMELLAQKVPDKTDAALKNLVAVREKQYQAAKGLDKGDAGEAFIEALLVAADASTKDGATEEAMAFLRKALGVAKTVKSDRQNEIQGQIDRQTIRERLRKQVSDLKARLVANPQDVAARKEALRLCLVDLDDPAEAATLLADSSDEAMRKYVPAAAKGVGAAPELACLELGQWYHGLAKDAQALSKPAMLAHARDYLERFLELHTAQDVNRVVADQILATIQEQLSKLGQGTAAPLERNLVLGVWFFRQREGPLVDSRRKPVAIQGEWRWVADDSFKRPTQTVEFRQAFAAWPNEPAFMLRTGSITAWVKYAGGSAGVAGKGLAGFKVGHDDYGIFIDGSRFGTYMGWPTNPQITLSAALVPLNRWCFLAYSWDEKKAAFWMDGRPLGVFPQPTPLKLTDGRFEIGVNSPGDPEYFVGCMAGVHLYNVFLTDKQVAELMKFEAQFMKLPLSITHPADAWKRIGTGNAGLLGGDLTDPQDAIREREPVAYAQDRPENELRPLNTNWLRMRSAPTSPPGTPPHQRHPYQSWQNSPACAIFLNNPEKRKWYVSFKDGGRGGPSHAEPYYCAVEFRNAFILTHFTLTTAPDMPDRDPKSWAIQGSNTGKDDEWTDIYMCDAKDREGSPLQASPRCETTLFTSFTSADMAKTVSVKDLKKLEARLKGQKMEKADFAVPARPYTWFRIVIYSCFNANTMEVADAARPSGFALGQLELFGVPAAKTALAPAPAPAPKLETAPAATETLTRPGT
jgi:hypothetical protein